MKKLSTDPYKGTRDFYPENMSVQEYIFDTWSMAAESFGFERYDASVLEPSELYKSKGAENAEMVNEQTYTFIDRGDREVTLRPEMTPTVARMIAGKSRDLQFPVRWYSIPNLFRYERPQRGRLREHWQLNCDIFGSDDVSADIEIIALANHIFLSFDADPSMYEIRINDRGWITDVLKKEGLDDDGVRAMLALLDKKEKIDNFDEEAEKILGKPFDSNLQPDEDSNLTKVVAGLKDLGIENVKVSLSTVRGFDYYTGTIFEFFDTDPKNNRSLLGGGRYDDLTGLFGGERIPGIGFGFGDVTMKDFLESHDLMIQPITSPTVIVIPTEDSLNAHGQKVAQVFRNAGLSAAVDYGTKKLGKKIANAGERLVGFAVVFGEDELTSNTYTLKNLQDGTEVSATLEELPTKID